MSRRLVIGVACFILLLTMVHPTGRFSTTSSQSINHRLRVSYTQSGPILVTSNAELDALGLPGSGTDTDPYVLENVNITTNAHCIELRNITKYLVIRDCLLSSENSLSGYGVWIRDCEHITVRDCIAENKQTGLNLEHSTMCQVSNCTTQSGYYGVTMMNCTETIIESSVIRHPVHCGIGTYLCSNCTVEQNVIGGTGDGIWNTYSENNTIHQNVIENSTHYAIYEYYSLRTTISDNLVYNTTLGAVRLEFSNYTTISGNYLAIQGWDGIRLATGSHHITVEDNEVFESGWYGICVQTPSSVVRGNAVSNSSWSGIAVENTQGCVVTENTVVDSQHDGIAILDSSSCVVESNTVQECNLCAITVVTSDDTQVVNNSAELSGEYGVWAWVSKNVTIRSNTLDRTGGIVLENASDLASIRENTIRNCFWTGIRVFDSLYAVAEYNTLVNITEDGLLFEKASHSIARWNTFQNTGWQGLSIYQASACTLSWNSVDSAGDNGILVLEAPHTRVTSNTVKGASHNGIIVSASDDLTVSGNRVHDSGLAGIDISEVDGLAVTLNQVTESQTYGVNIGQCRNVELHSNFINCSEQIDLHIKNTQDCLFYLNAFLTSGSDGARILLSTNVKLDNGTIGNYWESYTGTDEDGDGIGETPYELTSQLVDHYPLTDLGVFVEMGVYLPPSVSFVRITVNMTETATGNQLVVTVEVDYPSIVTDVIVSFSYDNGNAWQNVTAQKADDHWQATIPVPVGDYNVTFVVLVQDSTGQWVESEPYSYRVLPSTTGITFVDISLGLTALGLAGVALAIYRSFRRAKYAERMREV
ncbi:MAG: right-handed parallel beta-helix repeat-containing protein [Candidatus Thorarchaeota archaeon]